ncbi:hypothetical protein GJ744_012169 [Endocarpon pusillum]|uniref:diphosphoinositol-polyphosphate diphosphatase n=1 Tax=Endocarpon pusillum TaxID=364733 RepID=A0A8H7ADR1_9EURO|nr:hypothetical protein GJ744_012169 [Endocarpon pusillum]
MSIRETMPGRWVDSDDSVSNQETIENTTSIFRTMSLTMEEDKSRPPTPDGSGLPTNFHPIGPGIYRSSYPQPAHFSALKTYRFKTIITLAPDPLPVANTAFMVLTGIKHHHIAVLANKDPVVSTPAATVARILRLMLDKRNHPMLIHCNKGKHRTGCIAACFRKVTGWTDEACIAEYERHAAPKDRALDKLFIRRFEPPRDLKALALENGLVGGAFAQAVAGERSSRESERTVGTALSDGSAVTVG